MGEPGPRTQRNPPEAAEIRAEALEALNDAFAWTLADARWAEIARILDAMSAALASGDVKALAAATAHLELAGPLRIIPIGAAAGPPPPVRDLLNVLVHDLGGVTADGPPDLGNTGAGRAGFPVVDQEFIVHLFAPLDGPQAAQAYTQVQRIWAACRDQLGLNSTATAGLPGSELPSPEAARQATADSVLAFQEGRDGVRQAVLRRVHDVLNLSVALAQPSPEGSGLRSRTRLWPVRPVGPAQRRLTWTDYAALWARVSPPQPDALLGEAHLFLARTVPEKTGRVPTTAELGQELDSLLPYREDRPHGWWRRGITTTDGYALWDTGLDGTSPSREMVLVAAADRDEELSAWAWSDRSPAIPPFARYLMHAAKLRYEARLLDSWHDAAAAGRDTDSLVAELNAILKLEHPDPDSAELLRTLQGRLRAEVARLTQLDTDMARLEQTVSIAQRNLAAQPGCGPVTEAAGIFASDQALAGYVSGQVSSDRNYLQIELHRAKNMRELAVDALGQLGPPDGRKAAGPSGRQAADPGSGAAGGTPEPQPEPGRQVFVVYGRDGALAKSFFDLLYSVGLKPLEWERLVGPTGSAAPYLGDVVRQAPHLAQANLVLLSPDDVVQLHSDLFQGNDHTYEQARAGQARPNVLFELGLAYMANPERTVIVEVGQMRPVADLAGLNVIRFDGSAIAVKKVIERLVRAGCPADTSGESWLDPGRFSRLEAYRRGPGTSKACGGEDS